MVVYIKRFHIGHMSNDLQSIECGNPKKPSVEKGQLQVLLGFKTPTRLVSN